MPKILTKRSSIFLKSGAIVPIAPANFLEVEEEILITPVVATEEFKRVNGSLGSNDSYADVCDTTISQTIATKMRFSDSAATALDTPPLYGELLKIGGFDETIDASVGAETVIYTNTQTPSKGSAIAYVDGWKHSMTDTLVADLTMNFPIGKAATISAALSGFLDNEGVAVSQTNPEVALTDEGVLITGCADIFTAGGASISPDNVTIAMGAANEKFYGMGLKEYNLTDYMVKVTADFYPENANYNAAINLLKNQTTEAIVIKLGTNGGTLVNGKSVEITAATAKASTFSDSADKGTVKRSFTWLLTSTNQLSIKHGFFI